MSERPHEHHQHHAPKRLAFALLTISDTRRGESDTGGALLARLVREGGHEVARHDAVRDEIDAIRDAVALALAQEGIDVVVTTGGTGIATRDVTPEAIVPLLEKQLPGFGETFRAMSVAAIGGAGMSSRAFAGVARGRLVVALPGSPDAVHLAMERLVLPEAGHLVGQARR